MVASPTLLAPNQPSTTQALLLSLRHTDLLTQDLGRVVYISHSSLSFSSPFAIADSLIFPPLLLVLLSPLSSNVIPHSLTFFFLLSFSSPLPFPLITSSSTSFLLDHGVFLLFIFPTSFPISSSSLTPSFSSFSNRPKAI